MIKINSAKVNDKIEESKVIHRKNILIYSFMIIIFNTGRI